MKNVIQKIAILGASRGLGRSLFTKFLRETGNSTEFFLVSRKIDIDGIGLSEVEKNHQVQVCPFDFTHMEDARKFFEKLKAFSPTRLFYVAGGGPYGEYKSKKFKDHLWSYKLNLLFPAQLLHEVCQGGIPSLQQVICVGSSVAEAQPDPNAASYSSGKHGLKGLISTLVVEEEDLDLRLFSPPHMKTDMLPNKSANNLGLKPLEVQAVSEEFYEWANDSSGQWHREVK